MSSPLQAAMAAQASYTLPPTIAAAWGQHSIRAVITDDAGVKEVSFPGSDSFEKWFLDFLATPHSIAGHPELNTRLHFGFQLGFEMIREPLALALGTAPWRANGHSYGAAMALQAAVLMPRPPLEVYCFEPPRVFVDEIPAMLLPITQGYRCGNDPVTDVPGWFVQLPLIPIGRATTMPTDSHFIRSVIAAL